MREEIHKALQTLKKGGIILYPTDTVWGIGCDATNMNAVEKVYSLKKRDPDKSLIVLVSDDNMMNLYVPDAPSVAWDLLAMSEDPLTIVFEKVRGLAPNVIAQDGTCGIRIVKDAFCNKLIHLFGKPIVSTSANLSGEETSGDFSSIPSVILSGVDHIVNPDKELKGIRKPSSIVMIRNNGEVKVIRK